MANNPQTLNQVVVLNPTSAVNPTPPLINGDVMRLTQNGVLLPYIRDHIYCTYGKNFFTAFAENFMDKQYDSSTEIFHTEESPQIYTVKVNAPIVNASAAGGAATFTFSSTSNTGWANIAPGYFVSVPPLAKLAKVTSVNLGTKVVTIEPADIQYKITLTAGQECIVIPAAIAASCSCDTFPSSLKLPGLMYRAQMGIVKKNLKICGEDLAQWLADRWLFPLMTVTDPCTEVEVWWHASLDQMWSEFMMAKQMLAMTGEEITNTSNSFRSGDNGGGANGYPLKSTTGILHLLRARAAQFPVPQANGITIEYFRRITAYLKTQRNYCNQYGMWSGYEHRSEIDQTFEAIPNITRMDQMTCAFMGGDQQRCIRFGFDGIKLDGIEFYFHDEDSLNDPGFLGASGFNGPWTSFLVPLCKLPCQNKMATAFIMRYLAGNGVNRELLENDYGVLRPGSNQSNCDYHEWSLISQFGVDAYCMNNFIFTESI